MGLVERRSAQVAPKDVAAYLARLGVEAEPPSVDALGRLHRAHVERIPYESVWIHLGEPWGIDPTESVHRIAHDGRGGYCFHLNGALAELLDALGYHVTSHVGGVHGPDGPSEEALTNHLVLLVHDLPDDTNPEGTWYVDAGLGDALHDPLPLVPGEYRQGPLRFVLTAADGGVGDWHLEHDPAGSFSGMSFRAAPVAIDAFAERHQWLSTSPESGFVRVATVQRRHAEGVDILRGCVLTHLRGNRPAPTTVVNRREDWLGAADQLGLRLDVDPEALDRLWSRIAANHEAWAADQASSSQG